MKQQTTEEGFEQYIKEKCGISSEENRMYGHHFRSFKNGAEWKEKQLAETNAELLEALKMANFHLSENMTNKKIDAGLPEEEAKYQVDNDTVLQRIYFILNKHTSHS